MKGFRELLGWGSCHDMTTTDLSCLCHTLFYYLALPNHIHIIHSTYTHTSGDFRYVSLFVLAT